MRMNNVEMKNDMLKMVAGGRPVRRVGDLVPATENLIHDNGCGGIIENPLIGFARCTKCGEEHWFISSFKYHREAISNN